MFVISGRRLVQEHKTLLKKHCIEVLAPKENRHKRKSSQHQIFNNHNADSAEHNLVETTHSRHDFADEEGEAEPENSNNYNLPKYNFEFSPRLKVRPHGLIFTWWGCYG